MSEDKDLNKQVDKLEGAMKQYASKDTVISIGGYSFTPAKLMIAAGIVSSTLGGLYGVFEAYKDYMGMKKKIAEYVTPDLTEIQQKLAVLEEGRSKTIEFTRDINNNLKADIRRIEKVLEEVERGAKVSQREVEREIKEVRMTVDQEIKEIRRSTDAIVRETVRNVDTSVQGINATVNRIERETTAELRAIRSEVDNKIKKALDNPLADK
jgi:DNA anti-recombination protein RmuC